MLAKKVCVLFFIFVIAVLAFIKFGKLPGVINADIIGVARTVTTESVGGTNAHVVIYTNPSPNSDFKWQFLTAGPRLFIDRKDGSGFVQLVSQIQTAPEYITRQGGPSSCVWNPYGLNINTSGSNVLQGSNRQDQADGSTKFVKTYSTFEEGIAESLTETWTIPVDNENLTGPTISYSMSKNRGIVVDGSCQEGTWRMRWALSGISNIVSDNSSIIDGDGWPIRKKSYSNNEFYIDINNFDNTQNSSSSFSYSEIGVNNKAEVIFFKNGTTGNRVIDSGGFIAVPNISTGWKHNKQRNVLYNGAYFYMFYGKGGASLFAKVATSTANFGSSAEQTVLDALMLSNSEWDVNNFNNTSATIAYFKNNSQIQVKTCALSTVTSTIACGTASSTFSTPIAAAATDAITVTRTSSSNRLWVGARISDSIYVFSDNGTSWTTELNSSSTNAANEVTLIPYQNSDKVVFVYQRNPGGTSSDGVYSRAITRSGGAGTQVSIAVGSSDNSPSSMFGNGISVSDSDIRFIAQNMNASSSLIEYKYADNNSNWIALTTVTSTIGIVKIQNPALFYNRFRNDLYAIYQNNNTASSSIWMQIKDSDSSWGAQTRIDNNESDANTLPVANDESSAQFVYGYRNANGSNFDLIVNNITLDSSIISVAGAVFLDEGLTIATSSVKLVVNGVTGYTTSTNSSGAYDFTNIIRPTVGSPITVWMNNNGGGNGSGATVTRYTSTTINNLDIYKNRLIARHEDSGPITNGNLAVCAKTLGSVCADTDLHFDVSGSNLTVDNDWTLYLWGGDTYTAGGAVTLSSIKFASSTSVLNLGSNALTLSGDFLNSINGAITLSSGQTTTFNATTTGHQINIGSQSLQNVTFNGSGGGWTISSTNTTFAGNFTLTAGSVTSTVGTLNIAGNFTNSGAFNHNNGTVNLNGATQNISGSTTFFNLMDTESATDTLTFTSNTTQTITNILTLRGDSVSNRLSLRSNQNGSLWNINPQGTRNVSRLDIKDSRNINSTDIICGDRCFDSGNNIGWLFGHGGGGGSEGGVGGGNQQGGGGSGGGGNSNNGGGSEGGGGGNQQSGGGGQGGGDGGSGSVLATMGWIFKAMMEWLLNIFEKIIRMIYLK